MTTYNDVFGGANIYPSDISYRAVALTGSQFLNWPNETSANSNFVARIMDVTPSNNGFSLSMPDAREASPGETVMFNNVGSYTFVVKDAASTQLVSIAPGQAWQLYLRDNTTIEGTWKSFQFGAGTSIAQASSLTGTGIVAVGEGLSQSKPVTLTETQFTFSSDDRAKFYVWTGGPGTLNLPAPGVVSNGWFIMLRNSGQGSVTLSPPTGIEIDQSLSLLFQPDDSRIIVSDGFKYFTLGAGQDPIFAFDYVEIDITGLNTYTLDQETELNRIAYKFIGTLNQNCTIIVPSTVQQYWVNNSTTNLYSLIVKTANNAGIELERNRTTMMYCDGLRMIPAHTNVIVSNSFSGGIF